ncbi:MAG: response regulator [Candidatus Hydrogenedentes bacterium]|jgi:excisionase family DNA binding protein|nr:response regulator [Candidatus Hydrogenedentota bacterium]
MEAKQSFSTSDVAKYCYVTADTIRKWAEAGHLTVFRTPGGHRRIHREELLRFMKENKIPLPSDLDDPGVRVLIVDDEKAVISVIRRFLEKEKTAFHIESATDGFDAGRLIVSFQPDIVFLDLRLPNINGFEVCRRIKQNQITKHIHVVAMTGYYQGEAAQQVLELGATLLLQKPFTSSDLEQALEKAGVDLKK